MRKLQANYEQVKKPDIRRQLAGTRSRESGAAFEKLIETSCEVYKNKKLAHIEKTPEPMRPISKPDRQGRFTAIYTAAAQPDYKGTLSGGRAVVFEAKHTDSNIMKQERVTPAQADALRMHYALDALCFVLVSIKDRYFVIPWEVWDNMKQVYGRKYITAPDVKEYEAKIKGENGSVYLDFLSTATAYDIVKLAKAAFEGVIVGKRAKQMICDELLPGTIAETPFLPIEKNTLKDLMFSQLAENREEQNK